MDRQLLTRSIPRIPRLLLLAGLLALLIGGGDGGRPARAQSGITVQESQVTYSFGQQITFELRATAPAEITTVTLRYRVAGEPRTLVRTLAFTPGREVVATHVEELRTVHIPPFARITYWWEVGDAAGGRLTTPPQEFLYADNRFAWQALAGPGVQVHWVEGDAAFGQAALDVATQALTEINRELRAPLPGEIGIYIYPSLEEFQSALLLAGREWIGGRSYPELGVVLVAIPPGPEATIQMARDIPHELTHLLIYQAVGQRAGAVPAWLEEGLATLYEQRPDPVYQTLLEQALATGAVIPLEALCVGPFGLDSREALLSYAESASVVRYLRDRYGSQVIRDLLAAYADGASCEGGVLRVLETDLRGLERAWRRYVGRQDGLTIFLDKNAPWLVLWGMSLLLVVPLLLRWQRREARSRDPHRLLRSGNPEAG